MRLVDYNKKCKSGNVSNSFKLEYLRACYNVFNESGSYKNELKDRAIYEGVSVKAILNYAKIYMTKVLGMSSEECDFMFDTNSLNDKQVKVSRKSKSNDLLASLLGVTNKEEIIKLINEAPIRYDSARSNIEHFVYQNFPNKKFLVEVLRYKFSIYSEYLNKLKKEEKERNIKELKLKLLEEKKGYYKLSKMYITDFLLSEFDDVNVFCEFINLDVNKFNEYVKLAFELDDELYQKYINKVNEGIYRRDMMTVTKIKEMIYLVNNGISCDNGEYRDFDIIDYYQFIGADLKDLDRCLKKYNFTSEEIRDVKNITKACGVGILESFEEKMLKEDEKELVRNVLNGSYFVGNREIKFDEKERIINFLREVNAPLTRKNYSLALKRYLSGTLVFEESERVGFYKKLVPNNIK